MNCWSLLCYVLCGLHLKWIKPSNASRPNIVIILIDDLGFNDVSFHGSNQILTPNIDALAYNGVLLNKLYVPNLCTPSRSSLLTGRYPIHTGTQHHVVVSDEPWGLPSQERLMPEFFKEAGYSTYLVGKWHLGFWRKELTPIYRGFDHHFGYYNGYIDYYDHTLHMLNRNYTAGLDFRRDLRPCPEANGTYATDVFTSEANRIIAEHNVKKPLFLILSHLAVHAGNENDPMQAPFEEIQKFSHIKNSQRRTYAAMISSLDKSVGQTINALNDKGIINNTIVLLYSDNGAPTIGIHSNAGSNYPFRGQKQSPWEGAIRSAGVIWSPLLKEQPYVSNQVIHSIDLLPTLASAAGIRLPQSVKLDGVDMFHVLSHKAPPQSRRLLHVMDDIDGYSSYMNGNFKLVNGTSFNGQYDNWLGKIPDEESHPEFGTYAKQVLLSDVHRIIGSQIINEEYITRIRYNLTIKCQNNDSGFINKLYMCAPLEEPCLFNLDVDPCELNNLAKLYPLKVQSLLEEVEQFRFGAVKSARVPRPDPNSNPALHGGLWQWWEHVANASSKLSSSNKFFVLLLVIVILDKLS